MDANSDGTPDPKADLQKPVDTGNPDGGVTQSDDGRTDGTEGSQPDGATEFYADLDEDTRDWLEKKGVKSAADAAKLARDQSKLLGNAIRIPGDKASDEERNEFLNKLGRPEKADGYEFKVPEDLPESVPYDKERADDFKALAHSIGLRADQAAKIHDWAAKNAVADVTGALENAQAQTTERAKTETEKLVKIWGPLDGETARANLTFADRFLQDVGGPVLAEELQRLNLIGPNKEILSEPLAVAFAKAGSAIYKEDDVLRGNADVLNNPFADDKPNMTEQMKLYRRDPEHALSLIAAAGKKPEDFGLKAK